ncbi:hypothetical protein [Melittangium boletus]|uniref:Uncharacterized protein n=1 Tax=Melittangium boletus DSM 14713 TaxID=1294270 RepID=A0A250IPM8_9BACT|nr:hypothetical protein [Melittangium boletus]ATB33203.1 hypothetical protein MEBOL_006692 [Melittangium boletus DSM 14713]
MSLLGIGRNLTRRLFRPPPPPPPPPRPVAPRPSPAAARAASTFTPKPAVARGLANLGRTAASVGRQAARVASQAVARPAPRPAPAPAGGVLGGIANRVANVARQQVSRIAPAARAVTQAAAPVAQAAAQAAQRVQQTASSVATRAVNNPVAQSLSRVGGFAQRTLERAQPITDLAQGVNKVATQAQTAVRDVRDAVRNRDLGQGLTAMRSVADTVRAGGEVVAQASGARDALRNIRNDFQSTFPRTAQRLGETYQRAAGAASRVAERTGLNRVADTAQRLVSSAANNPVAQAFRRTAGFAARNLGNADKLLGLGEKVRDVANNAGTAARDIREAVRNPSLESVGNALGSSYDAARSVGDVVTAGREARDAVRNIGRDFSNTFPRAAERIGQTFQRAASTAGNVANRLGLDRVRDGASRLMNRAAQTPLARGLQNLRQNTRGLGGAVNTLVDFGRNVRSTASTVGGALGDIGRAVRGFNPADVSKAIDSTKNAFQAGRGVLDAIPGVRNAVNTVGDVAQRVAPAVSSRVADVASRAAQTVSNSAPARLAQRAAEGVGEAAARSGLRTAAKSAARFVPGANVAMAAVDTATFVNNLRDPNASLGSKITSGITALGSIASATNIPIVSQVGAGVSAVSDFIGGFF